MASWFPAACEAPETPVPPQPEAAGISAARAARPSQRALTRVLAATAREVAGEDLQGRPHEDDRRREQERGEALRAKRPQDNPDDQAGGGGEDPSHARGTRAGRCAIGRR